jgi:bidirectional [NiFe] hydrogenase diaphorase subunit
MLPQLAPPAPPTDDKRWKIVATTMRKLGNQRHALIEALHSLQQVFGYLDKPGLAFVAATLRIPLSHVYGAATFYHHFTLKPQGKHACVVCTGTACYIKGANKLLAAIEDEYGIRPGATSADGELSLLTARCFGTCGVAPAAVIDGTMSARVDETELRRELAEVIRNAAR